ncbi:MAG: hypothetical protein LH491_02235 [Pseudoxanthomonas sp.]|nr:hypothetical protein [Pseudoxanthomonas sp.]
MRYVGVLLAIAFSTSAWGAEQETRIPESAIKGGSLNRIGTGIAGHVAADAVFAYLAAEADGDFGSTVKPVIAAPPK